ncbi:MAG: phosphate ABC transporter substrate-binding protein PstS [Coleofasciculaceae cyanobacterium SM2_1_6]|nr:phosphate ABC transporter substrate-binding protein PstS [Coleofasciculaceae cyanobacterium SM2_1_6]
MVLHINFVQAKRFGASVSLVALAASLAACGGEPTATSSPADTAGAASPATSASPAASSPFTENVAVTGAGASFPAPLYQRWFQDLNGKVPQLQVNYQSVGSGAGIEQFTKGTVDFGASDTAMKPEAIAAVPADKGVTLLPMTAGSIVLAYNVQGVNTGLKLSREVYVGIASGTITKWNDPKIVAANPGVTLPDLAITFVHRSDGSGTTGVFTKHLSAISPEWKETIGEGNTVQWPSGAFVGAKGNEGVTAQIQQTPGAIGYIEYGYAKSNNVNFAQLENKNKEFVEANAESVGKTLASVTLPENLIAFISDPEGPGVYPIASYTWLLVPAKVADPTKAKALEVLVEYGLNEGQEVADELGYIPLPKTVREKVLAAADKLSADYTMKLK